MDADKETVSHQVEAQSPEQSSMASAGATAVDLDTQTGLKSPPTRRVGHVDSPSLDNFSGDDEHDGNEVSDADSDDDSDAESLDSWVFDLFHEPGLADLANGLCHLGVANADNINITPEQCEALNMELRATGAAKFMQKYLQLDTGFSLKEILYALGYILVFRSGDTDGSRLTWMSLLKRCDSVTWLI